MKRPLFLIAALALTLAGCATFGIQNAGPAETREGLDYKLLVNAWDKKASDLGVVFSYRVNGGPWAQKPGVYNGSLYEALVPGQELKAGYLEYYASMRNAKGETVSSKPVIVKVLTFAEAKSKAERDYLARLSDAGTAQEYAYDESAVFRLLVSGQAAPASVSCAVRSGSETKVLPAAIAAGGAYEAYIPSPHSVSAYSYQWTVTWKDPSFGELTSIYPASPKTVAILDKAAVKAKIEREFKTALKIRGKVEGSFFDPPVVVVEFDYGPILKKYSTGSRSASLSLRSAGFAKQLGMAPLAGGDGSAFSAEIPTDDLERGPLELTVLYSDSFRDAGLLQAQYPADRAVAVSYRSYAELRDEAVAVARSKLSHQPPMDALEGAPLSLRLDVKAGAPQVLSASLDGAGQFPIGRNIPFVRQGDSWYAAVPGAVIRPGAALYRITAVVGDPAFGELVVQMPASESYSVQVKSMKEFMTEREEALRKGHSHQIPAGATQGAPLELSLGSDRIGSIESASLYYRTAESPRYRELRGQKAGGALAFAIPSADTRTSFIQYYFVVTATDPAAGRLSATFRDSSGAAENDFLVVPAKAAEPVK